MEMYEQIWMWVSTAVTLIIIPLVTSLVKDADPQKAERWGITKSILLRIFSASTARNEQGEAKVSVPVLQSAKAPKKQA